MVPESITANIDEAWEALNKAFGEPDRLMDHRKEALVKLGPLPKDNARGGLKAKVEWYLQLEALLKSILDLGRKSLDLGMEAFSKSSINNIFKLFPAAVGNKLMRCPGRGEERLENILQKISEIRKEAQDWQLATGSNTCGGGTSGAGGYGSSDGDGKFSAKKNGQNKKQVIAGFGLPNLVSYNPPRRDDKCRICKQLEAKGDTVQLYDNHVSSYPTGCPRYMAFSVEQRSKIAGSAKLCIRCHDPDYILNRAKIRDHNCPIKIQKKSRYTCSVDACLIHMWICMSHKSENMPGLVKFKDEISRKFQLDFGLVVSCPKVAPFFDPKVSDVIEIDEKSPAVDVNKKTNDAKKVPADSPECLAASKQNSKRKNLSTDQAMSKMKKKLLAKGINEELRPVAKGKAQFMIGHSQGKTRALLNLYDTGCGGILFREGVPQKEVFESVMKTKGPFIVNGVGDSQVTVNDEWMCSMSLVDGTRQVFEGFSVDKITATLPFVNLQTAEEELKASDKDNEELQSLACQPMIGGDIDALIGILYFSIFPIHVHSLPNGLGIYKLQLTPHDKRYNSVIGGPHESFQYMAAQFGGMSIVFANLCQQLKTYKDFGPPKLTSSIMSFEEIKFAEQYREWDIQNFQEVLEAFDSQNIIEDELAFSSSVEPEFQDDDTIRNVLDKTAAGINQVNCSGCGLELSMNYVASVTEALMSAAPAKSEEEDEVWKQLQQAQKDGLNIEYRCPRCRSCSDCRRSFETERISLREEAEDLMIWDSVTLDWENKRIICYLPLRGKEEEFLTNNREMALKVLDQQCFKYQKDLETKEIIVKAFDKLLRNNQMVLWKDLSDEEKKMIESKDISHYIVWRVVFKPSISTPARPVFDASQKTKSRKDGTGGRCLNDAVVKGRVVTLNLTRMVLRFQNGKVAVQGDLKQFYASMKLFMDQWHLQRVLFKENLDPNAEVQEAVIKTLIWGIKCVSAQTECAIIKLAESVKEEFPVLADFLMNGRFVDDLGDSYVAMDTLKKLIEDADRFFDMLGLACKGWSFSGLSPPPDVTDDGETVSIGGMRWHTKLDLLEILLPSLHFSKKLRGRLVIGTEVFDGSLVEDMESFVPKKLTRRMIFSKKNAVFDLLGKFTPVMVGLSKDLREAVKETNTWDDGVSDNLRSKWVQNFWRLECLRGIKFQRARMPSNAVSAEMDLIIAADASEQVKIVAAWGRFRLDNGEFSCQLVIGRSLLADEDSTISRQELEALTMGSNLSWIVRQALEKWVSSYIVIGDSTISLCWVSSEKKRLSLYHRNRCVQIRRGVELEYLYHVVSEYNPADLGTRPEVVTIEHVGPNSKWEKGLPWMKGEIDDAISQGILTPAANLHVKENEEDDYNKGFVFEKTPEILTPGHVTVLMNTRVENVKARAEFSEYLLSPTKFSFEKTVRIYATIWRFFKSFQCLKKRFGVGRNEPKFQMFLSIECVKCKLGNDQAKSQTVTMCDIPAITAVITVIDEKYTKQVFDVFDEDYMEQIFDSKEVDEKVVDTHRIAAMGFGSKKIGIQFKGKFHVNLTDDDVSRSLEYLYKKGSEEVKKFNKVDFIKKISIEKNGILLSRSRILDSQRFQLAGGLEDKNILGMGQFGINVVTPLLDRYSPLSYSVGDYIHRKISKHGGYETCLRDSLNHCFIIQGMSLFRELGEDCVKCHKNRKKFIDVSMGPISDEQLVVAPPFWVAMCDIFGPCKVYVPGHSMQTRNRSAIDVKCYVLVFICPTTKAVNLQVIETKAADGIIDGVNRLGCEVGIPSYLLVDQESSIIKVLNEAEVNLKDLQLVLHKERGIKFKTCPVSGHNFHGAVERKIRTVQECLEKCDIANMRLHATGLQTLMKLIENDINNIPLGYSYGRDSDNSPLLKLIFPNMLRIGRINQRALDGPIKLPGGVGELAEKVEKGYSVFFKLLNITMIPKLMKQNKWFDGKSQLQVGDLVWFRKEESELASKWIAGKVTEVVKSKDDLVRRAQIQYQNSSENFPRFTDRAARSLIKLFNIDDLNWQDDMAQVERLVDELKKEEPCGPSFSISHTGEGLRFRLKATGGQDLVHREEGVQHRVAAKIARDKHLQGCQVCCCISHCLLSDHKTEGVDFSSYYSVQEENFPGLMDSSWVSSAEYEEEWMEIADDDQQANDFMSMLCAVNTDLGGDVMEETLCPGPNNLMV